MDTIRERLNTLKQHIIHDLDSIVNEYPQGIGLVYRERDAFIASISSKFQALEDYHKESAQNDNVIDSVISTLDTDIRQLTSGNIVVASESVNSNASAREEIEDGSNDATAPREPSDKILDSEHASAERQPESRHNDSPRVKSQPVSGNDDNSLHHETRSRSANDANSDQSRSETEIIALKTAKAKRPATSRATNPKRKLSSTTAPAKLNADGGINNSLVLAPAKRKNVVSFFKELTPLPRDFHQPEHIYEIFSQRAPASDPGSTWLLTRLFFAIASPIAFEKLREACTTMRQSNRPPIPKASIGLSETLQALDKLDSHLSLAAILRRYHLVSLKAHRSELEREYKITSHSRPRRTTQKPDQDDDDEHETGLNRADTQALICMMKEAYPNLKYTKGKNGVKDEYNSKLGSLKDRLRSGRNWDLMQDRFSPAILALVSTGEEYQINDSDIERLSVTFLKLLLDVLVELRGDFLQAVCERMASLLPAITNAEGLDRKFKFELGFASLKSEPPDSQVFIDLCEFEASSGDI